MWPVQWQGAQQQGMCGCDGGQHGPCSGKVHDDGVCMAAMGGGNVCGCKGGSDVAMQL